MQTFQSTSWLTDFAHQPSFLSSKESPGPVDFAPKSEEVMGYWHVRKSGLIAIKYLNLRKQQLSIYISDPIAQYCHQPTFLLLGLQLKTDRSRACVHFLSAEWRMKSKKRNSRFFLSCVNALCRINMWYPQTHPHAWKGLTASIPGSEVQYLRNRGWKTCFCARQEKKRHSFLKDPCSLVIYMQILIYNKLEEF